jgi:hypothetical protein
MRMHERNNHFATAADWRSAGRKARASRAEPLTLPSGAKILAARPEPLEWIMSGRVPQRLLAAALESGGSAPPADAAELSREDVLELARFAAQLVKASVVKPALGDGPDEIPFDDIPVEDRTFIFQWACRALSGTQSTKEGLSSPSADGLERFCEK